jgi:Domain of unknown function (DUF397)
MTTELTWRKSSYSGGQGNCVEAASRSDMIMVRDSKQADTGPALRFSPAAWRELVARVKDR